MLAGAGLVVVVDGQVAGADGGGARRHDGPVAEVPAFRELDVSYGAPVKDDEWRLRLRGAVGGARRTEHFDARLKRAVG